MGLLTENNNPYVPPFDHSEVSDHVVTTRGIIMKRSILVWIPRWGIVQSREVKKGSWSMERICGRRRRSGEVRNDS